jgi:hypothetical protein
MDSKSIKSVISTLNKCSSFYTTCSIQPSRIDEFLPPVFQFKSLEQIGGTDPNTKLDV